MREVLLLCWRDTDHPQGGGSERYLQHVGAQLAEQGMKVTLRTAHYPKAKHDEQIHGIRINRYGGRLTVYPRALLDILLARLKIGPLAGIHPDVIIDTQNGVPFFSQLVSHVPVTVLVHHCHREQWPVAGKGLARLGWWIESSFAPRVYRKNQYVTVSLPSAKELVELGINKERIAVVRNGVDPIPDNVVPGGPQTRNTVPTVSVLSRLVPHKQVEDALTAVAQLLPEVPELHLDVIGGGWWEQNLQELAHTLGIADSVTFYGHVSEREKHRILARSWVHVLPSRKEGWGLAVIEAGLHGVPTIGYRSSKGLQDSIVDQETGLLIDDDQHNECLTLTDALRTMLTDHELRTQLGEQARTRAQGFSWQQTAAGIHKVLLASLQGDYVTGLVSSDVTVSSSQGVERDDV